MERKKKMRKTAELFFNSQKTSVSKSRSTGRVKKKTQQRRSKIIPVCQHCKVKGHGFKYCPKLKCSHCGSYDHVLSTKMNGKIERCPNMWCEFCQTKKHTSQQCTKRKCHSCGEGHRTEKCGYTIYPFTL